MSLPAVIVEHVSKRYGDVQAVDDLSFEVAAGAIFGLLGPNGAGKTTALEIAEGLLAFAFVATRLFRWDRV